LSEPSTTTSASRSSGLDVRRLQPRLDRLDVDARVERRKCCDRPTGLRRADARVGVDHLALQLLRSTTS
jgi:hypothetical protein